jgi:hypothetical protein
LISVHAFSAADNIALFKIHIIIPVNSGDSILLKLPLGETMLIDSDTDECGLKDYVLSAKRI